MHPLTATTAALGLLVAGGAAGAALAGHPDRARVAALPVRPAPVEVRTEVIHRTVHVVRHMRREHRVAASPAPVAVPARPQPAAASGAPTAPRVIRPLRTRSSATGGEHDDRGETQARADD